jgi:DNA-binding MarR family transcriptional regulator
MGTKKTNLATKSSSAKVSSKTRGSAAKSEKKTEAAVMHFQTSPTHLLHRAEQCAADVFARIAPAGLLTPRQYAILDAIRANEGISQTGLVDKTGIDRSTLADIVRRMLEKGLVQRERTSEDARAYAVRLTRKGSDLLRKMRPYAEEVDRKILESVPEEYRNTFFATLSGMVKDLVAAENDAANSKSK